MTSPQGTVAFVGGGEFRAGGRDLDRELLATSGAEEVLVLPTAAAFENPDRVLVRAAEHFGSLGARVRGLEILHRHDADDSAVQALADSRFVYLSDGSPLHLRSVLKSSDLYDAMAAMYERGGVLAASGAGATVLGDPMVDPRGGAYTVGLGLVPDLAVFPYHGTAADHLRERSIDLLPSTATLVGIDEETALVRDPSGGWRVAGVGGVTVYRANKSDRFEAGAVVASLEV